MARIFNLFKKGVKKMLYQLRVLFLCLCLCLCLCLLARSVWAAGFQVNNNGTVTDLATGLIWQQQDDNVLRTHAAAVTYCNGLSLAGSSNWRLPAIKELSSIVDLRTSSPAIDRVVFLGTNSSPYWSASSRASSSGSAWVVNFGGGNVSSNIKSNFFYVRCVR